jgi:hypothetical protein
MDTCIRRRGEKEQCEPVGVLKETPLQKLPHKKKQKQKHFFFSSEQNLFAKIQNVYW